MFPSLALSSVEPFAPWLDLVEGEGAESNLKEAPSSCLVVGTSLGNRMGTAVTELAAESVEGVWVWVRTLGLEVSVINRLLVVSDT